MEERHYYRYQLFFCTHQRDGAACCADLGAQALRDYCKERVKALGLSGAGAVRINSAGCLGRCGEGPVMVVYPEGTWYTYGDRHDVDDIIESHLQKGNPVERLKI